MGHFRLSEFSCSQRKSGPTKQITDIKFDRKAKLQHLFSARSTMYVLKFLLSCRTRFGDEPLLLHAVQIFHNNSILAGLFHSFMSYYAYAHKHTNKQGKNNTGLVRIIYSMHISIYIYILYIFPRKMSLSDRRFLRFDCI